MQRNLTVRRIGAVEGVLNPLGSGGDHFGVHTQVTPVFDFDVVLGGIGVQHSRNVVLRVHGGKQHAGHSQDMITALFA